MASRTHPEDLPLLAEMIDRARGPGADLDYLYRLQMPNLSVKYLHLVAHGTRAKDGGLEYIGAIQDVTQRRLSEETLGKVRSELAHVARVSSLGVLTASIAHEVNQPLAGIVTNASACLRMLDADPPRVEAARGTARRMIRDGHRASDVIARLRALFARKSAPSEQVDLNEATREVIALAGSELRKAGVLLRADLANDLPTVIGDRVQLQQVILNLLLNAADAMRHVVDRPRQVRVRTERDDGNSVRLMVQDAGRWASIRSPCLGSSKPSTPPRPMAWGSVFRSVSPLSRATRVDCGRSRTRDRGPRSRSRYLPGPANRHLNARELTPAELPFLRSRQAQPRAHVHQVGERVGLHLSHHPATMRLHGDLADA